MSITGDSNSPIPLEGIMTQEILKNNLRYNSSTGIFTRINSKFQPYYNGKTAGREDNKSGYIGIKVNGKLYLSHRLAWLYEYGYMPNVIDHKNRIRNDNRIVNLRDATYELNAKNRGISSRNTSGVTGVRWNKQHKRWYSYVSIDGVKTHLGTFTNKEDAVSARKQAEKLHGYY